MQSRTNAFNYLHLATAATTQVKTGPGMLHAIIVNTPISAGTIKLIDNTTGSTVNIGTMTHSGTIPYQLTYDLAFSTGLRIIASGNDDFTVVYS